MIKVMKDTANKTKIRLIVREMRKRAIETPQRESVVKTITSKMFWQVSEKSPRFRRLTYVLYGEKSVEQSRTSIPLYMYERGMDVLQAYLGNSKCENDFTLFFCFFE